MNLSEPIQQFLYDVLGENDHFSGLLTWRSIIAISLREAYLIFPIFYYYRLAIFLSLHLLPARGPPFLCRGFGEDGFR